MILGLPAANAKKPAVSDVGAEKPLRPRGAGEPCVRRIGRPIEPATLGLTGDSLSPGDRPFKS
jgi:hypothetical protein